MQPASKQSPLIPPGFSREEVSEYLRYQVDQLARVREAFDAEKRKSLLMTVKQTAMALECSVATVWKLIRIGKLDAVRPGGLGITRTKAGQVRALAEV